LDPSGTAAALACAAELYRVNRWAIPFSIQGGKQQEFRDSYDPVGGRLFFWSEANPHLLYIVAQSGVYRVGLPVLMPRPAIFADDRVFYVTGLPEGELFVVRNLVRLQAAPRLYRPLTEKEAGRFREKPLAAEPASAEELAEVRSIYREKMGLLWNLVSYVEMSGYMAAAVNTMHGESRPSPGEIRAARDRCLRFFPAE
jgi:hypothetical protein